MCLMLLVLSTMSRQQPANHAARPGISQLPTRSVCSSLVMRLLTCRRQQHAQHGEEEGPETARYDCGIATTFASLNMYERCSQRIHVGLQMSGSVRLAAMPDLQA